MFNICFGCLNEQSHRDGSFEYPQHMFWLRNKKIIFSYTLLTKGLRHACSQNARTMLLPMIKSLLHYMCHSEGNYFVGNHQSDFSKGSLISISGWVIMWFLF